MSTEPDPGVCPDCGDDHPNTPCTDDGYAEGWVEPGEEGW